VYVVGHCKEWEQFRLEPVPGKPGWFGIRSYHNTYIGVDPNGNKIYSVGHCKEWEQFQFKYYGERVAIVNYHGTNFGVDPNGNKLYVIGHCKEWEQFTIVPV